MRINTVLGAHGSVYVVKKKKAVYNRCTHYGT